MSQRILRAMNEQTAFAHLLARGSLTGGRLRELTGLSKPTAYDVLRSLERNGLATIVGRTSGGPGPNAAIYAPDPRAACVVAVSVREDGPGLTTALADVVGNVQARKEFSADFSSSTPVDAVARAVSELCRKAKVPRSKVRQLVLAVPGSYDERHDTIGFIDVQAWSEPGIVGRIRKRLKGCEVVVDNDVNLAAIAERAARCGSPDGSAQDIEDVLASGFTLLWLGSPGLGLAIDLGGSLLRGARGGAGEVGYIPIGTRGDFQDLVGGPAVLTLAKSLGVDAATPQQAVTEAPPELLEELAARIAPGLAAIVAVLDPPLIVLGGEVGRAGGAPLREAVIAGLQRISHVEAPRMELSAVPDDAVLLGALDAGRRALQSQLLATLDIKPR